jgi:hypothetical protein
LVISTTVIINHFGITGGYLAIDEPDKKRAKSAKKIYKLHKIKDKASGGYVMEQKLVFIVLIAKNITIPVGFQFYMPYPKLKEWKKQDEKRENKVWPKRIGRPRQIEMIATLRFRRSH